MNTRRNFFKSIATFVGGVATAKASTYIPKKEEKKEEVLVPSVFTICHEGKEYLPLVVEKTNKDKVESNTNTDNILVAHYKNTLRKANI